MTSNRKTCIFCGSATNKMSREHVFRSALRKHAPDHDAVFHDHTQGTSRDLQSSIFDQTVRKVCKPCNEGWMHRLEVEVETVLAALIRGEDVSVSPAEGAALARWAAKTNVVRSHNMKSRSVPADAALKLMENRDLSDGWYVAIWRHGDWISADLLRHFDAKTYIYETDNPSTAQSFKGMIRAQEHILILGHFLTYSRFTAQPEGFAVDVEAAWQASIESVSLPDEPRSLPQDAGFESPAMGIILSEDRWRVASILPRAYQRMTGTVWDGSEMQ